MAGVNASTIQCEFITGSNAAGCMVLLTSENGQEEHYNLTKIPNMNCSTLTVTLKHPLSSYNGVVAFDIESDGSIGSLAISGQLRNVAQAPCIQAKTLPG